MVAGERKSIYKIVSVAQDRKSVELQKKMTCWPSSYGSWSLQLPLQSMSITTKVVSSNPVNGEVYLIQHYVIKFVSDLRDVGGFLRVLRFTPPIKLTATI